MKLAPQFTTFVSSFVLMTLNHSLKFLRRNGVIIVRVCCLKCAGYLCLSQSFRLIVIQLVKVLAILVCNAVLTRYWEWPRPDAIFGRHQWIVHGRVVFKSGNRTQPVCFCNYFAISYRDVYRW